MQGWIGRKDRFPVAIEAVVHRADGATVSVRLTDFSEEGCRMEGDDFHIGERLRIDVPRLGMMTAQVRDAGAAADAIGSTFTIAVNDHSYQAFKPYSDGSAAYPAAGANNTSIKIARVMPCQ